MAGPDNSGSRPMGDRTPTGDSAADRNVNRGIGGDRNVIAGGGTEGDGNVIAERGTGADRNVIVDRDVAADPDVTVTGGRSTGRRFESERASTRVESDRPTGLRQQDAEDRARQKFGGFNWGAAFFGWLVAVGIATLLTAGLSAAGAAIGLTQVSGDEATQNAETIGIVGGILLLAVLMIAYYAGGYVAGRMSRFDGGRQGVGTWLIGLLVTIALAVAGAVLGSEFNLLAQVNLPSLPIGEGTLTTGGIVALVAIVLGTLVAAFLGGKAGTHYHRKVDAAGRV